MTQNGTEDVLASCSAYLADSGLSERTIRNYVTDLRDFATWLSRSGRESLLTTTEQDIRAYRLQLVNARAHPPATVNRRLQGIRKFFRYAAHVGLVDLDPSLGVKLLPQVRSEGARGLDRSEAARLLDAVKCKASRLAKRDYAIVQLMLQTGIRVGELTRLRLGDVRLSVERGSLRIRPEGASEGREIPLNGSVRKAIGAYLAERESAPGDSLFLSAKRQPLSARSVQRLVSVYAQAAGLEDVSTYALRQTCGQELLRATGDLSLVARLMGHKRVESAIRYVQPGHEDLTEVAERSSLNVY